MNDRHDELNRALADLQVESTNFGLRFIRDARVRFDYMQQTKKLANEFSARVAKGEIAPREAAEQVNLLRNEIMEAQRMKSSDIGRALAVKLKTSGLSLDELCEKYALRFYESSFETLNQNAKNRVYLEIVESSGRSRISVNKSALKFSRLGRAFWIATIGIAVYKVYEAENKLKEVARQGVVIGTGVAGGMAGGAAAGLVCGPGAPICSTIGVFVGGAIAAFGADATFGWFF